MTASQRKILLNERKLLIRKTLIAGEKVLSLMREQIIADAMKIRRENQLDRVTGIVFLVTIFILLLVISTH